MPVHIVNEPSFGGRIGEALGTGLGGLLENLAQKKAQQLEDSRIDKIRVGALAPDTASSPQALSANLESILQQAGIGNQSQPSQNPLNNPAFSKLQEQQQAAQMQQQQPQQEFNQGRLPGPQQAGNAQPQPSQPQRVEPSIKDQLENLRRRKQALGSLNIAPDRKKEVYKALQNEENALRQTHKDELDRAERKQVHTDAETLPYYTQVKEKAEKASEMVNRIDQYEALLDTGEVSSNQMLAFLEELSEAHGYFGVGDTIGLFARTLLKAGMNTETEVAKKLGTDFMSGAKDMVGANMPVAEMQIFMQRVPNLMQTIEGQKALLRNFRAMADKDLATDKTMDAIIARNGDNRPKHLQSKVSNEMKSYKNNLRKSFNESIRIIGEPKRQKAQEREEISKEARGNVNQWLQSIGLLAKEPKQKKDYLIKGIRL